MSQPEDTGPLRGVRVVDLSSVIMGPLTTRILADFGADVIKVESPEGDVMRLAGPARHRGMSAPFMLLNRSKRSVVLDLKERAARDAFLRLCAAADVLVHNTRAGAMRRLALEYADVVRVNPAIVYVGLVGAGQGGPYADRPIYDDIVQGASGLASLFERSGEARPRYVPLTISDRVGGLSAANAVLAALFARQRDGRGQAIEVPLFETMVDVVLGDHLGGFAFDPPVGPSGYDRVLAPSRRPFQTKDGFVCILLYNEAHWQRFFELTGSAARYAADRKLSNPDARRENYDYAYGVVAEIVATRASADWLRLLPAADIPVMPLHDIESLLDDPHLKATGFFEVHEHPSEGRIRAPAIATQFGETTPRAQRPAPLLGEHTEEVLREIGFEGSALEALRHNSTPCSRA
ncbi:MAG TPA: CoA transferase [Candidatus Baltobacteraceae bacterium]|nr:CoA transferase [Candidatus Baltobacteraceae bacterium]